MNIGQQSSRSARRDEILRARKYEKVMWQIIGRLQQTYEVPVNDRRLQGYNWHNSEHRTANARLDFARAD